MKQTATFSKPVVGVVLVLTLGAGAYQCSVARTSRNLSSNTLPSGGNSSATRAAQPVNVPLHKTHQVTNQYHRPTRLADAAVSPSLPTSPELTALQAEREAQRVGALKKFLQEQGISEDKTQSAIIEQKQAQENARRLLQEAGHKLFPVLSRKGASALPEAQVTAQLATYEQAIKEYQDARRKSAETLEAQLVYSKNPHLRAVLVVLGLIGEGPPVLPL